MAIGFVLITTIPGEEESVRSALDNIEHVTDRWMLFGEFDILARVQADENGEDENEDALENAEATTETSEAGEATAVNEGVAEVAETEEE